MSNPADTSPFALAHALTLSAKAPVVSRLLQGSGAVHLRGDGKLLMTVRPAHPTGAERPQMGLRKAREHGDEGQECRAFSIDSAGDEGYGAVSSPSASRPDEELTMTDKGRTNREMRGFYARVASDASIVCPVGDEAVIAQAKVLGYAEEEIRRLPKGALVGLGCGNPLGFAELKKGETVIDLGCGGGRDALLASHRVGGKGRVMGLDMTLEMIQKAKANAREGKYRNVEFRLAEIENLPLEDGAVDCIISNCVINHSPDPAAVFREALRVLKPGGRMAISDLVIEGELSQEVRRSLTGSSACLAASLEKRSYLNAIERAGFQAIAVLSERSFSWEGIDPRLVGKVTSVQVKAIRGMRP